MPTRYDNNEAPVVEFDPRIEVSPFVLFRRLQEGQAPTLIDVRESPARHVLRGAATRPEADWHPPDDLEVVLFDEDGSEAIVWVERLQEEGYCEVKMLFGGLQLYEFALDPQVVGDETFLEPLP